MEFYEVLERRRSVRKYAGDPIDPAALERIGRAVNWAPSACNLQPWTFRVVMDPAARKSICGVYKAEWLKQAPAIVLAIGNPEAAWKRTDGSSIIGVDIGIAMEHLVLAAAAEGLATCWVCAYDVKKMNSAVGILPPWEVLAISPLGKAAETPAMPKRKTVGDVFKVIG